MTNLYALAAVVTPRLRSYVGAKAAAAGERDPVEDACLEAVMLVDRYITDHGIVRRNALDDFETQAQSLPEEIEYRAIIEVGAELYHRKNAKNAVTQFATADTIAPVRIARDPMIAARPLLAPWAKEGGFA